MRREGRLRGKPTNKSRSGGCGETLCGLCRLRPVEKSSHKSKGRYKRLAADMSTNLRLVEVLFQPLKELQERFPDEFDVGDGLVNDGDEGAVPQLGTVNSIIEAALGRIQGDCGDNWESDQGPEGSIGSGA
jgi:hypothetical protein